MYGMPHDDDARSPVFGMPLRHWHESSQLEMKLQHAREPAYIPISFIPNM